MRGFHTFCAFALAAISTPAIADNHVSATEKTALDEAEVRLSVNAFLLAISSDDKTDLADHMIGEAMIFVHNRMDPENPLVDSVRVAQHLENWATRDARYIEDMAITTVLVDGDMAHAWGPYSFSENYELRHCGINSLSLVRNDDGWKVANTSFTMEQPSECERLGVPGFPAEAASDGAPQ